MKKLIIPLFAFFLLGCADDPLPKPKAYLRLEYPQPDYKRTQLDIPFTFDKNDLSKSISTIKRNATDGSIGVDVEYPNMKGTIYLSYKKVTDSNLTDLLIDAQNLTQKHTMKADEIEGDIYENPSKKVYGMFYEVGGDAASQSQFYVTDSINHFLSGSLYFYAKPNYDSIYPAAVYLKNDIKRIMESLEWKN